MEGRIGVGRDRMVGWGGGGGLPSWWGGPWSLMLELFVGPWCLVLLDITLNHGLECVPSSHFFTNLRSKVSLCTDALHWD